MIWRVRDRETFLRFRREGVRATDGPLSVVFVADVRTGAHGSPPRVAFALSRKLGPAVVRNRVRRRLRAIFAELAGATDPVPRPGAYLVSARPEATALRYQELKEHVERALRRINARIEDRAAR